MADCFCFFPFLRIKNMWRQAQLFRDRLWMEIRSGATICWPMDLPVDSERELLRLRSVLGKVVHSVRGAQAAHSVAKVCL